MDLSFLAINNYLMLAIRADCRKSSEKRLKKKAPHCCGALLILCGMFD